MKKKCDVCGKIIDNSIAKCLKCGNIKDFSEIAEFVIRIFVDKTMITMIDLEDTHSDLYDLLEGYKTKVNIPFLDLEGVNLDLNQFIKKGSLIINTTNERPILELQNNLLNKIKFKNKYLDNNEVNIESGEAYSIGPFSFKVKENE